MTRIGSLFTGYGGLDMAAQSVFGGQVVWYSEIEPAACRVLAYHYPNVPNLGDITTVNWSDVEPVDVLTGGYPCQPFSHAGNRKGKNDDRHLWPYIAAALRAGILRPGGVAVFENVDGHRSLGLADVMHDLAGLGLSARWGVVRAADAGAPHSRKRVFIVAHASSRPLQGITAAGHRLSVIAECGTESPAHTTGAERREPQPEHLGAPARSAAEPGERAGAAANTCCERHGSGKDVGVVGRLGTTTEGSGRTASATWTEPAHRGVADEHTDWGKYESAIRRWEGVLMRQAPAPTITGSNGKPRLSPVFVEWMMGLPEGHVTGHGLSNAQQLKMLGNGVVPQQAALALRLLLGQVVA